MIRSEIFSIYSSLVLTIITVVPLLANFLTYFFTISTPFTSQRANGSNKINTIGLKYTIVPVSSEYIR